MKVVINVYGCQMAIDFAALEALKTAISKAVAPAPREKVAEVSAEGIIKARCLGLITEVEAANQKITIHTEDVPVLLNALSNVGGVFNMPNDESNGLAWSCQKDDTPFGEVSVMCYAPLEEVFPS